MLIAPDGIWPCSSVWVAVSDAAARREGLSTAGAAWPGHGLCIGSVAMGMVKSGSSTWAVGSEWADDTWADDTWADDTWADGLEASTVKPAHHGAHSGAPEAASAPDEGADDEASVYSSSLPRGMSHVSRAKRTTSLGGWLECAPGFSSSWPHRPRYTLNLRSPFLRAPALTARHASGRVVRPVLARSSAA